MANTIRLKRASGSDPGASDLVTGELAVRTDSGKLFTKKDDNSIFEIGGDATVADDAISTSKIQDDAVTFAKIQNVSATNRILGRDSSGAGVIEEIAPSAVRAMLSAFMTTGDTLTGDTTIASGVTNKNIHIDINGTSTLIRFDDDLKATFGDSDDLEIFHDGSDSIINDNGTGTLKLQLGGSTKFEIQSSGVGVTGNILVSGTVDGRDLATDGTKLDGIESGATADQTKSDIDALGIAASTATTLATARTIAGVSFDGSANISLNNNAITNGAGYITATLTNEQVQDIVGAMVSGNTESGISVTYQDGDGTLDFSVRSQTDNNFTTTLKNKLDGIAASATNVTNNNQLTNGAGYITSADGGNAATLDSIDSSQFLRSDTTDSSSAKVSFNGGIAVEDTCSSTITTLSDGSTVTANFTTSIHHVVTLGGNRTLSHSNTSSAIGQCGSIFIIQDGTGSRTLSFNSAYKFAGGTAPTLSTAGGAVDRIDYVVRASSVIHCAFTADVK